MVYPMYGIAAGAFHLTPAKAQGSVPARDREIRGGSMHLFDKSCNMLSSIPIVASSIPLALGVAMSNKIKNNKCVSLAVGFVARHMAPH